MIANRIRIHVAKCLLIIDPYESSFIWKDKDNVSRPHYRDCLSVYANEDTKIHIFCSNGDSLICTRSILDAMSDIKVKRIIIHTPYLLRSLYNDAKIVLSDFHGIKIQRIREPIEFWESTTLFPGNQNRLIRAEGDRDHSTYYNYISILFDYSKMRFVKEYITYTKKAWCEHLQSKRRN